MNNVNTKILLVLGILVFGNILLSFSTLRFDFTDDQRYTLSEGTKEILSSMEEPLTVKAYMSEDVNAQFDNHRNEVANLLEEYRELSNGNMDIEYINPNESEELAQEAQQAGIPPVNLGSQDRTKLEVATGYLGLIFEYGDKSDIIPFVQQGNSIEYPLTKSIKKITYSDKPKVGVVSGHGETKLSEMRQASEEASINYELEAVTLDAENLSDFAALVILSPKDSMSAQEVGVIDQYYESGGKLFIAYTNADVSFGGQQGQQQQPPMATERNHPIESWLAQKGVQFENSLAIDANAGEIMVNQGFFNMPVRFHYFPVVNKFSEHPISKDLNLMMLQFASEIKYNGQGAYTSLAKTSELSGSENLPVMFNIQRQWKESDFKGSGLSLAGAIEDNEKRMVVIANGELIFNGEGQQGQQVQPDNVNFFMNSLDWLTQNNTLLSLRNKGVNYYPIDEALSKDEGKVAFIKSINLLLPLVLIIVYGFIRFQARKAQRRKWASMP